MNKTLNILGLAQKANKLLIGFDEIRKTINNKKVFLILFDKNISSKVETQIKKISDLNKIPLIDTFSEDELSSSIGKKKVKVIGVIDEGFKNLLLKSLE